MTDINYDDAAAAVIAAIALAGGAAYLHALSLLVAKFFA